MLAKVLEHLLSNNGHTVPFTLQNKEGEEGASLEYLHLVF